MLFDRKWQVYRVRRFSDLDILNLCQPLFFSRSIPHGMSCLSITQLCLKSLLFRMTGQIRSLAITGDKMASRSRESRLFTFKIGVGPS